MLPDGEVEPLHERRVDVPAQRRQHLLDGRDRAKHDAVLDINQAPAPYGLDHLCVEQLRQGHPAWLGHGAFARVRSPASSASSNLLSGSSATHTHWGVRSKRAIASASLTSPSFTALRRANNSSSWTWLTCISWRKWRENACRCSAASTNHCNTVLGSTSKTRAVARIPRPSAKQALTRTSSSGATRLPWKSVPRVSRK